ncbi:hypothetical protein AXF42_Ash019219 [Apostasia shenzhenica]|uniref:Uncharacterized protein n=1 Tax=Apostasia shenzhenica TaxID=1088818 RepID=A0A2I0A307_9ASPA|nr:hypothetical protein AXF42_Ash019219 [Apostasia shenzhenica]
MTSQATSLATLQTGIMKDCLKLLLIKKTTPKLSQNNKTIYQTYILCDDQGEQMQATSFGNDVKTFDNILKEGRTYHMSNLIVSSIDPRYQIFKNDKQIKFIANSEIVEATDDTSIQQKSIAFTAIQDIRHEPENSNKLLSILSIKPITISLWDEFATYEATKIAELLASTLPVISITTLRRTTYQDLSVSTTSMTTISINPDISRSNQLRNWYYFYNLNLKMATNY